MKKLILSICILLALAGSGWAAAPTVVGVSCPTPGTYGNAGSIPPPTGCQAGDLLIMWSSLPGPTGVTDPSGWNLIYDGNGWGGNYVHTSWHVFQTGETSYTWGGEITVSIIAIRGANTTTPINVSSNNNSGSMLCGAPSITTTVANTLLVFLIGDNTDGVLSSWAIGGSTPAQQLNINSPTDITNFSIGIATLTQANAGATGNASCTGTGSYGYAAGFLLAIAPGAAAPAATGNIFLTE